MRRLIATLTLLAFVSGCAHTAEVVPVIPDMPKSRVEKIPLPPDPASEALPEGTPKGDWTGTVERGECFGVDGKALAEASRPCPSASGILVSEERAIRDGMFRLRYKELRQTFEADRKVFAAQRDVYEWIVAAQKAEIQKLQPSWWELHRGEICFIGGFVLGGVLVVGAASALPR